MLIKIIRLHVSLELPDGDCIGGRLQLVFSFFLFSPPALKKKKVWWGEAGCWGRKAALACMGWLREGCLLLYTAKVLV